MEPHIQIAPDRRRDRSPELYSKGWYHSIEKPDGTVIEGFVPIADLRRRIERMPIPSVLTGKRVLDVGAWDGWFSFEMERRGAQVVAADCVDVERFWEARRMLGSQVEHLEMDVLDLTPSSAGRFDIVLFLGVLYHVKNPMLALERVAALSTDLVVVESFITGVEGYPQLEFYETDELCSQLDNWFGPNLNALLGMCRSVGFARVELLYADGDRAAVACYRRWEPLPEPARTAQLDAALNTRTYGINVSSERDGYVACWFESGDRELTRFDVFPEVSGYGSLPIDVRRSGFGEQWLASFALPPGLDPGWHEVRVRTRDSGWSQPRRIALDLPPRTEGLDLTSLWDGMNWDPEAVHRATGGFASIWVRGLPENADRANIRVFAGGIRHSVVFVSEPDGNGQRQVNVRLHPDLPQGRHEAIVRFGPAESNPIGFELMD